MAENVQTTYRRNINPFVAGQIANARQVQCESGRLTRGANGNTYPASLPFGYAVGWVDGPADGANYENRYHLKAHVCARHYAVSSNAVTNFAGVAVRNVALPGAGTEVEGASGTTPLRVVDNYMENDLVSIGSEGDFVVVCRLGSTIAIRSAVSIVTADSNTGGAANIGTFTNAANQPGVTKASVAGAIFITDPVSITPYSGGPAQLLAIVRIRQQPR